MKRFNTNDAGKMYCKILTYGLPQVGKTRMIGTLPSDRVFVVAAEPGLITLKGKGIKGCLVTTMKEITEAYVWLERSNEAKDIEYVCVDSISEVGDICLDEEERNGSDVRTVYGNMLKRIRKIIRLFRDLPEKHLYMTARQSRVQDEQSRMFFGPDMPGQKLAPMMPYWFSEVFCLRNVEVGDGDDSVVKPMLQTKGDMNYVAGDRSDSLAPFEEPDLGALITKICG